MRCGAGLLLCARTPHARRRLTELMTNKTAAAAAAAVAAQHPEQATELCFQVGEEGQPSLNTCGCGSESMVPQPQEQQPLLRKLYRALVQGIVHEDEVRPVETGFVDEMHLSCIVWQPVTHRLSLNPLLTPLPHPTSVGLSL